MNGMRKDMKTTLMTKDHEIKILRNKLNQMLANGEGGGESPKGKGGKIIGGRGGGHTIRGKGHQTASPPHVRTSSTSGGASSPWATNVLNFFKIGQK